MSQAVGTRLFRKAGGMPPTMFRPSAKPLSGRYLSMRSARRSRFFACKALLRAGGCTPARTNSLNDLARVAAQRRDPKW